MSAARRAPVLLALSYLAFIGLGLPDGLLGVAWPSMRASFALPLDALGALLVATTVGYVASAAASGWLLARLGVGTLLAQSCLACALSLFGYAAAPSWTLMVPLGVLAGLGAGAIDAALNTYVATHHSARLLHLIHACYGLGTTAGPMIMTGVLTSGAPWQRGYAVVGLAQLGLAACFAATRSLWPATSGGPAAPGGRVPLGATLRRPVAWLAMATFFLYVGIEASAGAWTYSLLRQGRGATMEAAGAAVSLFWGGLLTGRVLVGLVPLPLSLHELLRLSVIGTIVAGTIVALDVGEGMTLAALAALGFACGPIFSGLVATTPRRLGAAHTANAVGVQVAAAALGQSLLPAVFGIIADAHGLAVLPYLMVGSAVALLVAHELLAVAAPLGGGAVDAAAADGDRQPSH